MKKDFGVKNWLFPMPVLMVGSYDGNGTADFMPATWGGVTLEDRLTLCIDTAHKTWANIAARKAFTVAFATADTVRVCDYLGLASANDLPGKVAASGLRVSKGKHADAPVAEEFPLVLECELVSMDPETCNVVGRILSCAVEESALSDGVPDAGKMKPVCYDPCRHAYRAVGGIVADAFSCGKDVAPRA
jgi:flavin reductase (DIM6/NTAB) family NADH-FMN oxidoreductase RutF